MLFLKKFFNFVSVFLLLPLAVAFSVYSLDQQGFFKIDKVDIRIQSQVSQKNYIETRIHQLQKQLDVFKGISLWKIPLSQISKPLSQEKWIKKFQISRAWPSGISIDIIPDKIELLVMIPDGSKHNASEASEISPITNSGIILEKIKSESAPSAVVSYDPKFLSNKKIRDGAIEVIKALPKDGRLSASRISEIGFDQKDGYWIKLLQSETKVQLGEEQFEIKSARISQVIDYLESRSLKARVIDANLSKKVLVRLQQNP